MRKQHEMHMMIYKHPNLKNWDVIKTTRSDLQGGIHLVREHPTEAIRHNAVHPTAHQRGPRRSTTLREWGSWSYHPLLSGSLRGG